MYSTRVVLETESKEIFQILAGLYHDLFLPQDQLEIDLVDSLVHARWKIRRLEATHSAELNLTIAEHRHEFNEKYGASIGPDLLQALAYRVSGKYLDTLDKHLDRQERLFARTYRNLSKCRKDQDLPAVQELQDLEEAIPSNSQNEAFEPEPPVPGPVPVPKPASNTQNERFEPSHANPFQKIAIIIVLLLSSLAFSFSWNTTQPPERTGFPYASL